MKWYILEPAYLRSNSDKAYYWVVFALLSALFGLIAWGLYFYLFNGELNDYLGIIFTILIYIAIIVVMSIDYLRAEVFSVRRVFEGILRFINP